MVKLVAVMALLLGIVMVLIPSLVGLSNAVRPLGVAAVVLAAMIVAGDR